MDSQESKEGYQRSRWVALYVLCVGMLMIVLDITVVNVALPSIQDDLEFSNAGLAWVVNAYLIAFGGLLLFAGRMGDLVGRRRIFLMGVALFSFSSVFCGSAQSETMLVVARFVQGLSGAMTSAVILGMIITMFPDPREQAKAIGVYAFVASAGGSVGLLAGGVITQLLNWHSIFLINVPVGVVTYVLARRTLPRDEGIGFSGGADFPGAALITGALSVGVYTIVVPAAEDGWSATSTLIGAVVSVALLGAFIVREKTTKQPLMPLRMFKSRAVAGANIIQVLSVAGMFGIFFLGSLYLQRVQHYDALEIGLAFLPATLVMGTLALRYAERLQMRFGAKATLVPGLLCMGAGLVYFTFAPVGGNYFEYVFPVMLFLGAGAGVSFPGLMTLAMSGSTSSDAGLASGLVNTAAQVGGALGLAILATISASRTKDLVMSGESTAAALVDGYHFAFWIAAGFVAVAIVVALFVAQPLRSKESENAFVAKSETPEAPVIGEPA